MNTSPFVVYLVVPMAKEPLWLTTMYVKNKLSLLDARQDLELLFVTEKDNEKNMACACCHIENLPESKQRRVRIIRSSGFYRSIKGGALHSGFQAALAASHAGDFIGFTDLDSAISNNALLRFVDAVSESPDTDIGVAIRVGRSRMERLTSAAFQGMVKLLFRELFQFHDLQAGLKLARREFLNAYYDCHAREQRPLEVSFNLDWDLLGFSVAEGYHVSEHNVAWVTNDDYSSRTAVNISRTLASVIRKRLGYGGGLLP